MNKFEKFLQKVKYHLISSIAILLGVVALLISGISFLASYINYNNYSENYEKEKEVLLANTPQLPKEVFRDNDYVSYDDDAKTVTSTKSKYKGAYVYDIHDADVKADRSAGVEYEPVEGTSWEIATGFKEGGSITYKIETTDYGKSDIDIVLAVGEVKTQNQKIKVNGRDSNTLVDIRIGNISDYLFIKVNGLSVLTSDFNLPADGSFQHLVLKGTHLLPGENTLSFETNLSIDNNQIMPAVRNIAVLTDLGITK
ncbi:MAG: hypothetical protein IKQ78_02855 [Bacilli bacterium]|nr:hypothetical protein [Bacilli bacterium]